MVLFGFALVQRCKHCNYSGYQGIFKGVGGGGGGVIAHILREIYI